VRLAGYVASSTRLRHNQRLDDLLRRAPDLPPRDALREMLAGAVVRAAAEWRPGEPIAPGSGDSSLHARAIGHVEADLKGEVPQKQVESLEAVGDPRDAQSDAALTARLALGETLGPLSDRDRGILEAHAAGYTDREIGRAFAMSAKAVQKRRERLLRAHRAAQ
jgi:hypothetical protein